MSAIPGTDETAFLVGDFDSVVGCDGFESQYGIDGFDSLNDFLWGDLAYT